MKEESFMPVYSQKFSSLLEVIAKALDIPENYYKQAVGRYESIGAWLERKESKVAGYNPVIYSQGSFLLGTVTKPISGAEEYDIDLVSELSLQKTEVSQEGLKKLVGDEIKFYAHANNMSSRPEESRRCWTLNYADGAQFHADILPAIPDAESFKQHIELYRYAMPVGSNYAIAITDNTHCNYAKISPDWPHSNPRGYAEWFRSRMQIEFDAARKFFAESRQLRVEDVPEYKVKTPLQRTIQILKRHRDIWFEENQSTYDKDAKPISIIITTLAAHAYNNEVDLQQALLKIVMEMPRHIKSHSNGTALIPNPVNPLENFADKWQEYPIRKACFMNWLKQAQLDLTTALKLNDVQSVGESLKPSLGKRVISQAQQKLYERTSSSASAVAASVSSQLNHLDVTHRQDPKWPVIPSGRVTIIGIASRKGFRTRQIESDSTPLPKYWSLRFEAQTNVLMPYEVHWQVVNTGAEAYKANGLRGGFYKGSTETHGTVRKENTEYKGKHWIECFIVKDGICCARSGEFVVNIE